MTEKTSDEPLESSIADQLQNSLEETMPSEEKRESTPNQDSKNMEVHHHAHHEGKKNWKSFFWEFIMLFLAVFCGSLAENVREHKIENDREVVYIKSLIKDIEYDTLQFGSTIKKIEKKVPLYDSVLLFLKSPEKYSFLLPFRFYINTNLETIYTPLEPTLQQLKSSGNLRLIEKKLVLDSLLIYDSKINGPFRNQNTYVVEFNKRLVQFTEKVFDNVNFNAFLNDVFADKEMQSDSVYDVHLVTKDNDKITEMQNLYINAKATDVFYMKMLKTRKADAQKLLALIKREYKVD